MKTILKTMPRVMKVAEFGLLACVGLIVLTPTSRLVAAGTGGPPLLLEPVQATITLKGSPATSVQVVDVYGVPTGRQVERTGDTFRIDGRNATYYYEVRR